MSLTGYGWFVASFFLNILQKTFLPLFASLHVFLSAWKKWPSTLGPPCEQNLFYLFFISLFRAHYFLGTKHIKKVSACRILVA